MGIDDSPLRDRVVFVEGAPRSGTSWLTTLLATHPQLAGIASESHLFDFGIDRVFDNYELAGAWESYLVSYLSREQLAGLVREFCDGVLLSMRDRVKPEAEFVIEKTPLGPSGPWAQIERKRECYPDAWFLHIVRDGRAVTESLMRAPFVRDPSPVACFRRWREAVASIRQVVGDHPRYRELRYEDLRADPIAAARTLFGWVGVDAGEDVLHRVRAVSQRRYATFEESEVRLGRLEYTWARALDTGARARRLAASTGGRLHKPWPPHRVDVAAGWVSAAREGDLGRMRTLGDERLVLEVRGAEDRTLQGEEALQAFVELMARAFARTFVDSHWDGADGVPFVTIVFSGMAGDGSSVDLSLHLFIEDRRVTRVRAVTTL